MEQFNYFSGVLGVIALTFEQPWYVRLGAMVVYSTLYHKE